MSPTLFPSGFRISGRPVAASFAHPHSFILQAEHAIRDDACIDASAALGGRDSGFTKYWDESTVASELTFEVETEKPAKRKEKKTEKIKEKSKELLSKRASIQFAEI